MVLECAREQRGLRPCLIIDSFAADAVHIDLDGAPLAFGLAALLSAPVKAEHGPVTMVPPCAGSLPVSAFGRLTPRTRPATFGSGGTG